MTVSVSSCDWDSFGGFLVSSVRLTNSACSAAEHDADAASMERQRVHQLPRLAPDLVRVALQRLRKALHAHRLSGGK